MQLMPATAREMAKANNVSYNVQQLNEPGYNSLLGASYLRRAYDQLGQNEVYATAAYNAGISRAKSWLQNGRDKLPLDIWIETIPFYETRGYVQNVMAFSAIYANKLNTSNPMQTLNPRFFEGE
jgi:soluble lytic murein transglycosylase